jgi:2-polyprenyl-3-methyl-5-hydroxy-6-metoxy-1,4-benzoquinol methylase
MKTPLDRILLQIKERNPDHYTKLDENMKVHDQEFYERANLFLEKYEDHLTRIKKDLSFGVDCYLKLIDDMLAARLDFIRTGAYANSSFAEVEASIYARPEVMTYHMHGLVLAQFLWFDQYERILFFSNKLKSYLSEGTVPSYLEVGGGHGLYLYEALKLLPAETKFEMIDISESSLALAKGVVNNQNVSYYLKNIFDFEAGQTYDFVTMGELIEHVEDPLALLKKAVGLLSEDGVCYMTTPVNAPMIDHIYLFNDAQEIKDLVNEAGFEIIEDTLVVSEKMELKRAMKRKVPLMYAAFMKRKK